MSSIQLKIKRHAKKQESLTQTQKKERQSQKFLSAPKYQIKKDFKAAIIDRLT